MDGGYDSHAALAKRLNVSRPVISKAENAGQPVPSDALLTAWAGHTGAPADKLLQLAQRARSGTPEWFMPFLVAEAEANVLRYWSPVLVPGVLQCEAYVRAVLSVESYTPEELDELVAARLERQAVIGRAHVTVVVDQHAIHRLIGTAAVMAEQCAHLLIMAERPRISLHVVPEGANVGLWGGFDLAASGGTTTVCLSALEDIPSTAEGLVGKALLAFERILGAALPRSESLALIRTVEERWKAQI